MEDIEIFDQASAEAFHLELIQAGFEPVIASQGRCWVGPIHPAFKSLTEAKSMKIRIRDGWPFFCPVLFVKGLDTNHLTEHDYVCMWQDGDGCQDWLTLGGFFSRIEQWCAEAQEGWDSRGLARDAYLNFTEKHPAVATLDIEEFVIGEAGTWGRCYGIIDHQKHITLKPNKTSNASTNSLKGYYYSLGNLSVPPRNLRETLETLSRPQSRQLKREIEKRKTVHPLEASGSVDLIILCWNIEEKRALLVLAVKGSGNEAKLKALQVGPTDLQSLKIRAGPDAPKLADKSIAVFGLGALGGHTALLLAESGVGSLVLIDSDQILPENVVRHVAGRTAVGQYKPSAVKAIIDDHAPWVSVECICEEPRLPSRLEEIFDSVDMVVDATGTEAATQAFAFTSLKLQKPLVSGALYRGGAIARIQRQAFPEDIPLASRDANNGHPPIPLGADQEEFIEPPVGCSAPVNNAPPSSVTACATQMVQMAIDYLADHHELPDEIICVYRPLPNQPPFDRIGMLLHENTQSFKPEQPQPETITT